MMSHDTPTEIWLLKDGHYQKSFWHVIVLFFLVKLSKLICVFYIYWCILWALPHLSAVLEWEDIKILGEL